VGCPIDWHVVPRADPPPQRAPKAENSVNEVPWIDGAVSAPIQFELPETITLNELAFLEGIVVF
jgi:hypothetical protein